MPFTEHIADCKIPHTGIVTKTKGENYGKHKVFKSLLQEVEPILRS